QRRWWPAAAESSRQAVEGSPDKRQHGRKDRGGRHCQPYRTSAAAEVEREIAGKENRSRQPGEREDHGQPSQEPRDGAGLRKGERGASDGDQPQRGEQVAQRQVSRQAQLQVIGARQE